MICFCRWEWWNLWFECGLLLALLITCFLEAAFKRGRMCFLAFFVLATQGLMWSAHNFLTALELTASGLNTRDLGQDAINAGEQQRLGCAGRAFAGCPAAVYCPAFSRNLSCTSTPCTSRSCSSAKEPF